MKNPVIAQRCNLPFGYKEINAEGIRLYSIKIRVKADRNAYYPEIRNMLVEKTDCGDHYKLLFRMITMSANEWAQAIDVMKQFLKSTMIQRINDKYA